MVYWETAHTLPDQPPFVLDYARQWQAADKIVFSKTLAERDLTVDGPELAEHALRAGLVDELQMIVCPVVGGGGRRFFPDGV